MILKILKNTLLPNITSTKAQVSALDTALSKRGETTKTEVLFIFWFKVSKWLFMVFIILSILFGWIDLWKLIKIITASKLI